MTTYSHLVGTRVLNVHQPDNKGTVVEVLDGCNTLFGIIFDGRDFKSWLPVQDVALVEKYPQSRF